MYHLQLAFTKAAESVEPLLYSRLGERSADAEVWSVILPILQSCHLCKSRDSTTIGYNRLAGYSASLRPSLPDCLSPSPTRKPATLPPCLPLSLPPSLPASRLPHPLSILGLPGFAQNICVIAQDNCIPRILFKT